MPEVCIIIPTYNHAHYLPVAMHSILQQTFTDWQAIIVDDGSTDHTPSIVAEFGDPRVGYVHQENRGLSGARNTGIRLANANIIALLDADDLWEPQFLDTMLARLYRDSGSAAIYGGYGFKDAEGTTIGHKISKVVPSIALYSELLAGNWLSSSAILLRRSIFTAVGVFDEALRACEDLDMWLRIAARYPVEGEPAVLSWVRRSGNNMSDDANRMVSAYRTVMEKHLGSLDTSPETWPQEKQRAVTQYYKQYSHHMLLNQRIPECAESLLWLVRYQPHVAFALDMWYTLACVHQGIALRGDITTWNAERGVSDIEALLSELAIQLNDMAQLRTIGGLAHLALAKLLYAQRQYSMARSHLRQSVTSDRTMLSNAIWTQLAVRLAPGVPLVRSVARGALWMPKRLVSERAGTT